MAPRYPIGARLPVSTPYSYDPNAPPPAEVESLAASRYTGPLFSEPRSYQHSLTSHSTHSGDDGNDTEDSASKRGPEEDAPTEPGPSRRVSRKRKLVESEIFDITVPSEPTPAKKGKKTEKACHFCRSECHLRSDMHRTSAPGWMIDDRSFREQNGSSGATASRFVRIAPSVRLHATTRRVRRSDVGPVRRTRRSRRRRRRQPLQQKRRRKDQRSRSLGRSRSTLPIHPLSWARGPPCIPTRCSSRIVRCMWLQASDDLRALGADRLRGCTSRSISWGTPLYPRRRARTWRRESLGSRGRTKRKMGRRRRSDRHAVTHGRLSRPVARPSTRPPDDWPPTRRGLFEVRGSLAHAASPSPGSVAAPSLVCPGGCTQEGWKRVARNGVASGRRLGDGEARGQPGWALGRARMILALARTPIPNSWRQSLSDRVGQTRPDFPLLSRRYLMFISC